MGKCVWNVYGRGYDKKPRSTYLLKNSIIAVLMFDYKKGGSEASTKRLFTDHLLCLSLQTSDEALS